MNTINKGDRVKYARTFLRSVGAFTGPIPFRIGTVQDVDARTTPLAYVQWDDEPQEVSAVLVSNLVRADRLHLEAR